MMITVVMETFKADDSFERIAFTVAGVLIVCLILLLAAGAAVII